MVSTLPGTSERPLKRPAYGPPHLRIQSGGMQYSAGAIPAMMVAIAGTTAARAGRLASTKKPATAAASMATRKSALPRSPSLLSATLLTMMEGGAARGKMPAMDPMLESSSEYSSLRNCGKSVPKSKVAVIIALEASKSNSFGVLAPSFRASSADTRGLPALAATGGPAPLAESWSACCGRSESPRAETAAKRLHIVAEAAKRPRQLLERARTRPPSKDPSQAPPREAAAPRLRAKD
mmetsp:Transcript_90034/g.239216  ORF Transcript_90034/g.239216 Transcript_90034/m.239216 type:complete len:237 (+) Transcript_90034:358-1068(+)